MASAVQLYLQIVHLPLSNRAARFSPNPGPARGQRQPQQSKADGDEWWGQGYTCIGWLHNDGHSGIVTTLNSRSTPGQLSLSNVAVTVTTSVKTSPATPMTCPWKLHWYGLAGQRTVPVTQVV